MSDTNWNDVGDKIKDAVDSAISTGDFSNLSRSIGDVINDTIDNVKGSVKTAAQQNKKTYSANPYYKTIHTESAPDQPQPPALYNKRPGGQAGAIISMALGYSVGIFTLAGVISFIALSAAVSHMFSGSPYHFRCTCSRWFLPWYQGYKKNSSAEPLSKLCAPD